MRGVDNSNQRDLIPPKRHAAPYCWQYPCHSHCIAEYVYSWWRHQMETFSTFSALLAFVRGIDRWPVDSPHRGHWRWALMFSLIWAWTNGWANDQDAGDLKRHPAHYDVTVMSSRHVKLCYTFPSLFNWSLNKKRVNYSLTVELQMILNVLFAHSIWLIRWLHRSIRYYGWGELII